MAEDLITEGVQVRHTLESIGMRTEVEDIMKTIEMSSDLFTEPMVHFRELGQGHNGPLHGRIRTHSVRPARGDVGYACLELCQMHHAQPLSGVFIIRPSSVAWDGLTSARF
ncbi:hypothetical protein BDV35DRAFT_384668 [Aspergillus flavus]|uniref:Uncharacterized protein n=1 Tax=Aspergillus flavus TaxID=5059 RepID=A0A5N6GHD8_ASPFL|nr:hypothetical protein BDV35DRAFT_384668 [Aspergillus flavus]